jgi:hypothetical protein
MVRAQGGERRRICSTKRGRLNIRTPGDIDRSRKRWHFDRSKPQLSEARLRE